MIILYPFFFINSFLETFIERTVQWLQKENR